MKARLPPSRPLPPVMRILKMKGGEREPVPSINASADASAEASERRLSLVEGVEDGR
jgi:hypothetical protein